MAPLASPPPGYGGLLASPHKTKAHEFSLDPAAPFIDAPPVKTENVVSDFSLFFTFFRQRRSIQSALRVILRR